LAALVPLMTLVTAAAIAAGQLQPRAMALVILMQALLVGSAQLALQTGEQDEERVERFAPESAIEAHEEAAEAFAASAAVVLVIAAVAAGAAAVGAPRAAAGIGALAWASSLGQGWMAYDVGHRGGELVYVHNAGAATSQPLAAASGASGAGDEHGDEDEDEGEDD
jgi:hypothetical protein